MGLRSALLAPVVGWRLLSVGDEWWVVRGGLADGAVGWGSGELWLVAVSGLTKTGLLAVTDGW